MMLSRLFALALALMFAVSVTQAQEQTEPQKEAPKSEEVTGPQMSLESNTVDYGEIVQGDDPLRTVSFTNTGTEPLLITNARGSCGCTVPTYPKEPIAPGESAEIEIRYDTKRLGKINKTVRLTTNDTKGSYVIKVVGNISQKPQQESLPEKKGIFNNPNN